MDFLKTDSEFYYYLFLVITCLLSGWAAIENWRNDAQSSNSKLILLISLFGLGVAFISSLRDHSKAEEGEEEVKKQRDTTVYFQRKTDSLQNIIDTTTKSSLKNSFETIDSLKTASTYAIHSSNAIQNTQKSVNASSISIINKLKKATDFMLSNITGGNSYCVPSVIYSSEEGQFLGLLNAFQFPLSNIDIRVIDYTNLLKCPFKISNHDTIYSRSFFDENSVSISNISFGKYQKKGFPETVRLFPATGTNRLILIQLSTKLHEYYIQLIYKRDSKLVYGYRIIEYVDGKNYKVIMLDDNYKSDVNLFYDNKFNQRLQNMKFMYF